MSLDSIPVSIRAVDNASGPLMDAYIAAIRYRYCRLYALADVPDPGLRFSDLARGSGHFSQHLKDQYHV